MNPFTLMHRGVDALRRLPIVRARLRARFRRDFMHDAYARLFDGVYGTFDEALAAIPRQANNSYDNRESIERYVRKQELDEYDYPSLFWISESLREGSRAIADVGGSVGIKYYAFSKFTGFQTDVAWLVIDVPAAVRRGRELALERGASSQLAFTDSLRDAESCDVLFCSGSLQFLPMTLTELVASLGQRPRRIIVNTTPIHESRTFFTLHSMGTGICPYRVVARKTFLEELAALGYSVRHQWRNLNKDMRLPFHRGYNVEHFSGFCFDRI